MNSNELKHYGVLGMKWGVRRTPEQLGHHKIPKGTMMYRVVGDPNESLSGIKYVSFLPPDRDRYRGSYAKKLAQQQGKSGSTPVEKKLELTQDLNIPGRTEVDSIISELMKDPKVQKSVGESYSSILKDSGFFVYSALNKMEGPYNETKFNKLEAEAGREFSKNFIKNFGNKTREEMAVDAYRSLGKNHSLRTAVIKELTNRGYNAMVDEASVGGRARTPREGVEPLIIFDGEKSFKELSSTKLSETSMRKADERVFDWQRTARKHYNKPW